MLSIWWHGVNWLLAFPVTGMGEGVSNDFTASSLARLRSLPTETSIPFIEFADKLIEETDLAWSKPDGDFARSSLQTAVRRMIIDILKKFECVTCTYRDEPLGKMTISKLVSFQITPFGQILFEGVAMFGTPH